MKKIRVIAAALIMSCLLALPGCAPKASGRVDNIRDIATELGYVKQDTNKEADVATLKTGYHHYNDSVKMYSNFEKYVAKTLSYVEGYPDGIVPVGIGDSLTINEGEGTFRGSFEAIRETFNDRDKSTLGVFTYDFIRKEDAKDLFNKLTEYYKVLPETYKNVPGDNLIDSKTEVSENVIKCAFKTECRTFSYYIEFTDSTFFCICYSEYAGGMDDVKSDYDVFYEKLGLSDPLKMLG